MTTTYAVTYTYKGRKVTREIGGTHMSAEQAIGQCKILNPEAAGFSVAIKQVGGRPIKKAPPTKLDLRMEKFLTEFRTPELVAAMKKDFGLSVRVDVAGPRTSEGSALGAVLHEALPVAGSFQYHAATPAEAIALIERLRAERKWVKKNGAQ